MLTLCVPARARHLLDELTLNELGNCDDVIAIGVVVSQPVLPPHDVKHMLRELDPVVHELKMRDRDAFGAEHVEDCDDLVLSL